MILDYCNLKSARCRTADIAIDKLLLPVCVISSRRSLVTPPSVSNCYGDG